MCPTCVSVCVYQLPGFWTPTGSSWLLLCGIWLCCACVFVPCLVLPHGVMSMLASCGVVQCTTNSKLLVVCRLCSTVERVGTRVWRLQLQLGVLRGCTSCALLLLGPLQLHTCADATKNQVDATANNEALLFHSPPPPALIGGTPWRHTLGERRRPQNACNVSCTLQCITSPNKKQTAHPILLLAHSEPSCTCLDRQCTHALNEPQLRWSAHTVQAPCFRHWQLLLLLLLHHLSSRSGLMWQSAERRKVGGSSSICAVSWPYIFARCSGVTRLVRCLLSAEKVSASCRGSG